VTHEVPKLLALDLDGVLTETRETHVLALEGILDKHGFPVHESHLWELDGLSTRQRLRALASKGLIPDEDWFIDFLDEQKARATDRIISTQGVRTVIPVEEVERMVRELRALHGVKVCVVSNARRSTVELCLKSLGKLAQYISFVVAGDDGHGRKPDPEPYLAACRIANVRPSECVAVDDSPRGRMSARLAGVRLLPFDPSVSAGMIRRFCESGRYPLTIVVPMAGRGSRFSEAGYALPKPMIDVCGKPMIERVLECLPREANFVFILPPESLGWDDDLPHLVSGIRPGSVSWRVSGVTEGAACTVLGAEWKVGPDERIVVANCDQLVHGIDWDEVTTSTYQDDGFVLVFEGSGDKWSYAIESPDRPGYADAFVEKRQVGNLATCGVYSVDRSWKLFAAIKDMVRADDRTNGEFYLCPALNYLRRPDGEKPSIRLVRCGMTGLGTPEDLEEYVRSSVEC
jgi:beta-phosphoglucomutase-like phosphatase (HAD superfamily)/dTDP-glucose pyrophosphorylase